MDFVAHTKQAIERSAAHLSKLTPEILQIEGMSSAKVRHLLNNLLNFPDPRYLEIGCWKGSTLISALYQNNAKYWAIENWSEFGGPKQEFAQNFRRIMKEGVSCFDQDCFGFDPVVAGISNVNVYFYDGWHAYESHFKALTHFMPSLAETFIFVVDDWSSPHIGQASRAAIAHCGLKILFEQELPGKGNDTNLWWSGMGVFVLQK